MVERPVTVFLFIGALRLIMMKDRRKKGGAESASNDKVQIM